MKKKVNETEKESDVQSRKTEKGIAGGFCLPLQFSLFGFFILAENNIP